MQEVLQMMAREKDMAVTWRFGPYFVFKKILVFAVPLSVPVSRDIHELVAVVESCLKGYAFYQPRTSADLMALSCSA
jgi:hypothetical protein